MTTTAAPPTTPKEWEDYLNGFDTPEAFQSAFADGSFQDTVSAYVGAQNAVMNDLRSQVDDQVQLAVHDMLTSGNLETGTARNRLDLVARARHTQTENMALHNPNAVGAHLNGMFGNPGEAFQAVIGGGRFLPSSDENARKVADVRNYSEKVPSEGGILVPEEWRSDIMTRALEASLVRPRATVIPMPTGKLRYPANDMTTEVGEVFGGMVFAWMDEGGTIPLSDAAFAAIALEANKLGGGALIPNELLRDAPAFTVWLRTAMPNGIAHFEDLGYLKGNGVKKPLGALHPNNPALIVAAKEVGQPSVSITWRNVLSMLSRLLPESYPKSVWLATPDALPEIYTMALDVGTGGSAIMVGSATGPDGTNALQPTLLGRPIIWTRKTPATLGTQGDLSLVDLSTYLIGDTMDMRVDSSEHVSFWTDKTGFRVLLRTDGQPQLLSALTPENGGPTLSSYVQLESR
jgi:HK97 family phage major capsid protein